PNMKSRPKCHPASRASKAETTPYSADREGPPELASLDERAARRESRQSVRVRNLRASALGQPTCDILCGWPRLLTISVNKLLLHAPRILILFKYSGGRTEGVSR